MIDPAPVFAALTTLRLAAEIERWGWSVGRHTYGHPMVLEPELAKLRIGRFCSIGPDVTIVLGDHRTDLVTTYPFQAIAGLTAGALWPGAARTGPDHHSRGDVVIGDEVWLGTHCIILSGVTIGSGAVIGAGAVVRRDVPPYAIVTGNPAEVVRHRFDAATVARLLRAEWWAWPDEKIAAFLPMIMSPDVAAFLDRVEAEAKPGKRPRGPGRAARPSRPGRAKPGPA